jgi:hypothetical protein
MQYSYLPSVLSLVTDQRRVDAAGPALVGAVVRRWQALPEADRPRLVLYGESLGSRGIEVAMRTVPGANDVVDGVLLVGPPNSNPTWSELVARRDPGSPLLHRWSTRPVGQVLPGKNGRLDGQRTLARPDGVRLLPATSVRSDRVVVDVFCGRTVGWTGAVDHGSHCGGDPSSVLADLATPPSPPKCRWARLPVRWRTHCRLGLVAPDRRADGLLLRALSRPVSAGA